MLNQASTSVCLFDWGGSPKIGITREAAINELLLLSAFYDHVLIQDEVLALSDTIADWFSDARGQELLNMVADIGATVVITLPELAYKAKSDDEHLLSDVTKHPIKARAAYVERFSNRAGKPFIPSNAQLVAYGALDNCLRDGRLRRRPTGSLSHEEPTRLFRDLVLHILQGEPQKLCLATQYPSVDAGRWDRLIRYIEDPARIPARRREAGLDPGQQWSPIFSRSAGYQLAECYSRQEQAAIQTLVDSCFATVFAANEQAAGRYGQNVRQLILNPYTGTTSQGSGAILFHQEFLIKLPPLDSNFVKHFRRARESEAGLQLRRSVAAIEAGDAIQSLRDRWRAFEHELFKGLVNPPIEAATVRTLAVNTGLGIVTGLLIGAAMKTLDGHPLSLWDLSSGQAKSTALGLALGFSKLFAQIYVREIPLHFRRNSVVEVKLNQLIAECRAVQSKP